MISDFFHSLSGTVHSAMLSTPRLSVDSPLALRGLGFLSAALRWLSVASPRAVVPLGGSPLTLQ